MFLQRLVSAARRDPHLEDKRLRSPLPMQRMATPWLAGVSLSLQACSSAPQPLRRHATRLHCPTRPGVGSSQITWATLKDGTVGWRLTLDPAARDSVSKRWATPGHILLNDLWCYVNQTVRPRCFHAAFVVLGIQAQRPTSAPDGHGPKASPLIYPTVGCKYLAHAMHTTNHKLLARQRKCSQCTTPHTRLSAELSRPPPDPKNARTCHKHHVSGMYNSIYIGSIQIGGTAVRAGLPDSPKTATDQQTGKRMQ
jgi:hypothetical protein